jgi:hypothetical protein
MSTYQWRLHNPTAALGSLGDILAADSRRLGIEDMLELTLYRVEDSGQKTEIAAGVIALKPGEIISDRGTTLFLGDSIDMKKFFTLLASEEKGMPQIFREKLLATQRKFFKIGNYHNLTAYDLATSKKREREIKREREKVDHKKAVESQLRARRIMMDLLQKSDL